MYINSRGETWTSIYPPPMEKDTLQGINISHLGKTKIIFKMPFLGGYVSSLEGISNLTYPIPWMGWTKCWEAISLYTFPSLISLVERGGEGPYKWPSSKWVTGVITPLDGVLHSLKLAESLPKRWMCFFGKWCHVASRERNWHITPNGQRRKFIQRSWFQPIWKTSVKMGMFPK